MRRRVTNNLPVWARVGVYLYLAFLLGWAALHAQSPEKAKPQQTKGWQKFDNSQPQAQSGSSDRAALDATEPAPLQATQPTTPQPQPLPPIKQNGKTLFMKPEGNVTLTEKGTLRATATDRGGSIELPGPTMPADYKSEEYPELVEAASRLGCLTPLEFENLKLELAKSLNNFRSRKDALLKWYRENPNICEGYDYKQATFDVKVVDEDWEIFLNSLDDKSKLDWLEDDPYNHGHKLMSSDHFVMKIRDNDYLTRLHSNNPIVQGGWQGGTQEEMERKLHSQISDPAVQHKLRNFDQNWPAEQRVSTCQMDWYIKYLLDPTHHVFTTHPKIVRANCGANGVCGFHYFYEPAPGEKALSAVQVVVGPECGTAPIILQNSGYCTNVIVPEQIQETTFHSKIRHLDIGPGILPPSVTLTVEKLVRVEKKASEGPADKFGWFAQANYTLPKGVTLRATRFEFQFTINAIGPADGVAVNVATTDRPNQDDVMKDANCDVNDVTIKVGTPYIYQCTVTFTGPGIRYNTIEVRAANAPTVVSERAGMQVTASEPNGYTSIFNQHCFDCKVAIEEIATKSVADAQAKGEGQKLEDVVFRFHVFPVAKDRYLRTELVRLDAPGWHTNSKPVDKKQTIDTPPDLGRPMLGEVLAKFPAERHGEDIYINVFPGSVPELTKHPGVYAIYNWFRGNDGLEYPCFHLFWIDETSHRLRWFLIGAATGAAAAVIIDHFTMHLGGGVVSKTLTKAVGSPGANFGGIRP